MDIQKQANVFEMPREQEAAQITDQLRLNNADDVTIRRIMNKLYLKDHRAYWRAKRTLDIIICGLATLILSPLLLLTALAVYIECPSVSPIFKQTRVGRHGVVFKMYKFRTMVPNAEDKLGELRKLNEMDGPVFKIKDDPRITKLGRILRKTSIDELPQLINILKGDMTIVGPRPALPSEVKQYTVFDRLRLLVTPGLTCYWQIKPRRNDITFAEWVEMDVDYITNRNLIDDFKLILLTIRVMITGQGR